jgi:hypothetical protein
MIQAIDEARTEIDLDLSDLVPAHDLEWDGEEDTKPYDVSALIAALSVAT